MIEHSIIPDTNVHSAEPSDQSEQTNHRKLYLITDFFKTLKSVASKPQRTCNVIDKVLRNQEDQLSILQSATDNTMKNKHKK
jgi:hypothetical protein